MIARDVLWGGSLNKWRSGAVRGPKAWPDVWLLGLFRNELRALAERTRRSAGSTDRVLMVLFAVRFVFHLESEMTPEDRARYERDSKKFSIRRGVAVVIAAGIVMVALWPEEGEQLGDAKGWSVGG